jgi:RNA polymerase sigma-70 factor (ECF subfamily)
MGNDNVTSLSLLERARAEDQAAWERLVRLYGPLVYHWCRLGGAGEEDAHDVVQEVFIAVSGSLKDFQHQHPGSFRAWMRGITRHKLLDFHRRRYRQPQGAGGTDAWERIEEIRDPIADSEEDAAEVSGLYQRALDLIRDEFESRTWQAFWRVTVDGQATDMAASELGMSAVAVRIAKSRVLARLREEAGELVT